MGEDAFDDRRLADGGDDLQLAAAAQAVLEVDLEDTLVQPCPYPCFAGAVPATPIGRRLAGLNIRSRGRCGGVASWPGVRIRHLARKRPHEAHQRA